MAAEISPNGRSILAARSGLGATLDWLKRPIGSNWERVAAVLAVAVLIAARLPNVIVEGRFWAEEGQVYFAAAWRLPWWQALVYSWTGYVNIAATLVAIVASHAPLLQAPHVSNGIALFIQCIPAMLVVTSRQDWLQPRWVCVTALLLITMPVATEEVWISAIESQYHLALATAFILSFDARHTRSPWHALIVGLAAVSAPTSWLLLPLFALRALLDRSRVRAAHAAILVAGLVFELIFHVPNETHPIGTTPSLWGAIVWTKHVLVPFLGPQWAREPAQELAAQFTEQGGPLWPLLLVCGAFAVLLLAAWRQPKRSPLWLLLAAGTMAGGSYLAVLGSRVSLLSFIGANRYMFAPQVLLALSLLSLAVVARAVTVAALAGVVVAWLLIVDATYYFIPSAPVFAEGPSWRAEVAAWEKDPDRALKIWPTRWTMRLSPRRAGSPPSSRP